VLTPRHAIIAVAASCCILQIVSATLQTRSFETPNSAVMIARSLAGSGEFSVAGLRAFQLPAEPLYLAAGFRFVPHVLWPYLHLPVTLLMVLAVTAAALAIGGPGIALAAGLAASLDPFVLAHGPVWDDVFLAAALEWSLFALLIGAAGRLPAGVARHTLLGLAAVAAAAAMTRTLAQAVIAAVAVAIVWMPRLRPLRAAAIALAVGLTAALAGWGARNALVLGTFFVGTTHDGESFFESNCAYTREGIRRLGVVGFQRECSEAQFEHAASLSELDANRQFRQYAFEYIASHPVEFGKTAAFKAAVSLSGVDFTKPALSARNVAGIGSSLVLLLLGPIGLWQLWCRLPPGPLRDMSAVVAVVIGTVTLAMLALGPTGIRYRLTLNGALWIGVAALAADRVPRVLRAATPHPEQIRAISS
jgi:hypothetical protein